MASSYTRVLNQEVSYEGKKLKKTHHQKLIIIQQQQ
jgi:hypothetical protein